MENERENKSDFTKTAFYCVFCVIICLLVGYISKDLQTQSLEQWYPTLEKSALTPPQYVFPIVWGALYILSGLSVGLVLASDKSGKWFAVLAFCGQLAANFLWSFLFFGLQTPSFALIDCAALLALSIVYMRSAAEVSKIAGALFFPYVVWCAFATYLNLYIAIFN